LLCGCVLGNGNGIRKWKVEGEVLGRLGELQKFISIKGSYRERERKRDTFFKFVETRGGPRKEMLQIVLFFFWPKPQFVTRFGQKPQNL
jgi:hypothetical protein